MSVGIEAWEASIQAWDARDRAHPGEWPDLDAILAHVQAKAAIRADPAHTHVYRPCICADDCGFGDCACGEFYDPDLGWEHP